MKIIITILAVAATGLAHAQVPANGSFESGNFNGWTVGLSARANVLQATHVGNQIQPTDGQYFAFLSTGPGQVGGPTGDLDGNAVTDFDLVLLQTQLQFNTYPAFLQFDWSFPTDEEDQDPPYDDVFRVDIDGQALFGRSSCKPGGGISPFPPALCGPFPNANSPSPNIGGGGPTGGTRLRFGIPDWRRFCQPIPGAVDGANNMTLTFRAGDQSDAQFDSALLLDNVRVVSQCEPPGNITIEQRTGSTGASLETKDGDFIYRPATMNRVVSSADGSRIAFIAGMDFPAGTNAALHQQVFIQDNSGQITRITAFTGENANNVHSISLSPNGRWLAVAARAVDGAAMNIWRYDLNSTNPAPTNLTGAANCDSHSPAINNGGDRMAFITGCAGQLGISNPDGSPQFAYWNGSGFISQATTGCASSNPAISMATGTSGFSCSERAVFASNCSIGGANAAGNQQIWRFQRNYAVFSGCTNAGTISLVPQQSGHTPLLGLVDISTNGDRVGYVIRDGSDAQRVIAQDWGGGNRTRVGADSAPPTQIAGFSMQRVANPQVFAITRLITGQGQWSVSLARVNNDQEHELLAVSLAEVLLPATAYSLAGSSRQVHLISASNLQSGESTGGYPQIFRVREN